MSLAALVDSEAGVALMLPLLLSRGGDIRQVDSKGRTLLHFAVADPLASYLIENGAPLPGGTGERLPDGVGDSLGSQVRPETFPSSCEDNEGDAAPVTWSMHSSSSESGPQAAVVPMSLEDIRALVRPDVVEMMEELGYFEPTHERQGNDPFYRFDAPPLTAFIPAAQEIARALLANDEPRTRRLIELGGATGRGRFAHTAMMQDGIVRYRLLTPVALAVVQDSERGKPGMLLLFEAAGIDLSAPGQADGGQTLLHLARSPAVCTWLLEHGASPDVANDAGQLSDEVLPAPSAAVVGQWRLARTLSEAEATIGKVRRI